MKEEQALKAKLDQIANAALVWTNRAQIDYLLAEADFTAGLRELAQEILSVGSLSKGTESPHADQLRSRAEQIFTDRTPTLELESFGRRVSAQTAILQEVNQARQLIGTDRPAELNRAVSRAIEVAQTRIGDEFDKLLVNVTEPATHAGLSGYFSDLVQAIIRPLKRMILSIAYKRQSSVMQRLRTEARTIDELGHEGAIKRFGTEVVHAEKVFGGDSPTTAIFQLLHQRAQYVSIIRAFLLKDRSI